MNTVKSASKLNGCFITLYRTPRTGADPQKTNYYSRDTHIYKRWNYFYNPMINSRIFAGADPDCEGRAAYQGNNDLSLTWQLQINNKYTELNVNPWQKLHMI
ncbi:MAG: hypothetical protein NXI08_16625 [bacterium]|nr:hypothetical protein [bacterium]